MNMDTVSLSSFSIAGFLYVLLQIFVTAHILRYKDDVKSSIGWIGLVWLTPLLGSIFYVLFGINRIRRKALSLRNKGPNLMALTGKTEQEIRQEIPRPFFFWQLRRTLIKRGRSLPGNVPLNCKRPKRSPPAKLHL